MVRDGYYYAIPLLLAALLIGWLATRYGRCPPACWLHSACGSFAIQSAPFPTLRARLFRRVTARSPTLHSVSVDGMEHLRISIFLNVFNVHVNRSPIGGVIWRGALPKGKFLNAMDSNCATRMNRTL